MQKIKFFCLLSTGFLSYSRNVMYDEGMQRFPEQFIQQVLQTTDIVELVGRYVQLAKKGREFVGLCPFHEDSNPSMYVSPVKQIFKCFACGAGGNALQFVMLYDKLTFPEAIRNLADLHNMVLPKEYDRVQEKGGVSRNDLLKVTEFASKYFSKQLFADKGKAALDYVRGRGLTDQSIEKFGMGYAPDSWDSLLQEATAIGYSRQQLLSAGLCRHAPDTGRHYDYFRNRLIFPISDLSGRVVAFGGRAMSSDDKAKYLNSPQGPLYDKSSLMYPIDLARDGITRSGQVVIVEGYFDALLPMQEGMDNVVATLGTSLTERHVRLLNRYAREAVLVFDADVAGLAAAERAMQLFLTQKLHIRIATIPQGKDPCDYVVSAGGDAMRQLVKESPDALEHVWNLRYDAFVQSGGNPAERNRVIDDFLQIIVNSGQYGAIDPVRQQSLAQHIAHVLNVSAIDLQRRMKQLARGSYTARPTVKDSSSSQISVPRGPERQIIEILLHHPNLIDEVFERVDVDDFSIPELRPVVNKIWSLAEEGDFTLEKLMGTEEMLDYGPLIAELTMFDIPEEKCCLLIKEATAILVGRREARGHSGFKDACIRENDLKTLQDRIKRAHELPGHGVRRPKIQ